MANKMFKKQSKLYSFQAPWNHSETLSEIGDARPLFSVLSGRAVFHCPTAQGK